MRIGSFNIRSGGFETYEDGVALPPRLPAIRDAVRSVEADIIGLVDTFRWAELFRPEEAAQMFGYRQAYLIDMDDSRVDSRIGLVFLSNLPLAFETIRLWNRDCIKARAPESSPPLVLYLVYLDDLDEDVRLRQVRSLLTDAQKHPGEAVVVMGDLNSLRQEDIPLPLRLLKRVLGLVPRRALPTIGRGIYHLLRGEVASLLRAEGFEDADQAPRHAPTVGLPIGKLPWIRVKLPVDQIWSRPGIVSGFRIWPEQGGSDHFPVTGELSVGFS